MSRDSLIKAIKHRRRLAGLTQEQLAEKAGISKKTYKRIEQGVRDITWSEYERILEALNVSEFDMVLDRFELDNVTEHDLLAVSRLFPEPIRRLITNFLTGLYNELKNMK
ncbi:hypothetical protein ATY35_09730 [Vibrio cidicii]|uniref:HTH cro/C1-type domain-containing protein n=1 Tax=Vibrio cidicii TaxID=1763883 RepID=A0ABR5W870_9VIBR|nr:hypothetical protein ATY35_09730 [Vibrio cidicii]